MRWPVWRSPWHWCLQPERTAQAGDACQTVAPQPAVVVPQQDPDAVVQSAVAEPSPVFDESITARIKGRLNRSPPCLPGGYIESAMRETMLAAVHSDYPLLGMRDVRLTDPVAKFLTSAQARTTAHDYLYAGVQRRLGRPLSPPSGSRSGRAIPSRVRVSDWVKQTKRVLAGR